MRAALMRAAEEAFAEHGVAAASVASIAEAAGVPESAFHLHFESKPAALAQILQAWIGRCAALFARPVDYQEPDPGDDPDAILDFVIERDVRLYQFLWDTRTTVRAIQRGEDHVAAIFAGFRAEMQRRNREWLAQWRRDGLLRAEVDLELATTLMSGAFEELSRRLVREPSCPPLEDWLAFTQETFVRGFGSEDLIAAVERRSHRRLSRKASGFR